MSPQLPAAGDPLAFETLSDGESLVVFRVVRADEADSDEFRDSFRSRAELGLPPRSGTPEAVHPEINDGISVYETQAAAVETARRVRRIGRDIGGFVAELRVERTDVRFIRWGARGHLTLWGDSLILSECTVDTIPID